MRPLTGGLINLHQTGDLGRVAHLGSGAVRFDEFDRVR